MPDNEEVDDWSLKEVGYFYDTDEERELVLQFKKDIDVLRQKLIEDLADTNKLYMLYAKHTGVFDWDKMIRGIINKRFGVV